MLQKFSKSIFSLFISLCFASFLVVLRLIKISPLWGGCFSYFSLTDVLMPLSGLLGFGLSFFLVGVRVIFRSFVFHTGSIAALYHIPGFCASFYWAQNSLQRATGIIIPVICMTLFLVHPVGRVAALYTTFWFIPILISLFGAVHPFYRSLASTFIAHSVGSVIWLYTKNLTSSEWLSLIPVVIVERFTFACIMTGVYYLVRYAQQIYKSYSLRSLKVE